MNALKITTFLRNISTRGSIHTSVRNYGQNPSINRVILMGAASSPRIRDLPSGTRAVEFTLATSHPSHNEEKKALRYHKIKSYNNTIADLVGENLGNDNRVDVYVEGSLATRRYLDKNGEKRYETFVYGDKVVFLAPRMSEAYESTPQQEEEPTPEGW